MVIMCIYTRISCRSNQLPILAELYMLLVVHKLLREAKIEQVDFVLVSLSSNQKIIGFNVPVYIIH